MIENEWESSMKEIIKKVIYLVLILAIIFVAYIKFSPNVVKLVSSSDLIEKKEIEEISMTKMKWQGIAEAYTNPNNVVAKGKTYIMYEAEVKVSFDIKEFKKSIKVEDDRIYMTVPKPNLEIILLEDKELDYIPKDTKITQSQAIKACKEDAEEEVSRDTKIIENAKENFKKYIEGLLYTFTENSNYKIVWKDGE